MTEEKNRKSSFPASLMDALDSGGNITLSPLSVRLALAMAACGAEGETKAEMLSVLGIGDPEDFGRSAAGLTERYRGNTGITFSAANALVLNETRAGRQFSLRERFSETVSDAFGAALFSVPEKEAVQTVNAWVSEQTNGRIRELLPSPDFLACLVNAVYLKAGWEIPFDTAATADGSFTCADGCRVTVPLMHMTKTLSYYEEDGLQIVRLPYEGGNASMLVALGLFDGALADYLPRLRETRVRVTLPRFTAEYSVSLKDALRALGMEKCFTDSAEFGAMFDGGSVTLSDVVHKACVRVTEAGTEAAAATAVMVCLTALFPEEPAAFCADRPFAWSIVDGTTGETLFCGRVNAL